MLSDGSCIYQFAKRSMQWLGNQRLENGRLVMVGVRWTENIINSIVYVVLSLPLAMIGIESEPSEPEIRGMTIFRTTSSFLDGHRRQKLLRPVKMVYRNYGLITPGLIS